MEEKIKALENIIQHQELKLQSLIDITNIIHHNFSFDKIAISLHNIIKNQLGIEHFVIFYFDEEWKILTKTKSKLKVETNIFIEELLRFKKRTLIESSSNEFLDIFDIVIPVYHEEEIISYIVIEKPVEVEDEFDIEFLQAIVNVIVLAIQNQSMVRIKIQQQSLQKEIEVASMLQSMLFPAYLPSNIRMDISARYIQREKIGGDYYDFIELEDDNYALCIADVSGKGIAAALLMSNFQASVRALFGYQKFELEYLIHELNKIVINASKGEKFITCFIAIFNAKTRDLTYINAGHNYPILTDGSSFELLKEGTTGLGMFQDLPFLNIGMRHIPNNTTLVLYTDGVVELPNKSGDFFEIKNLVKILHNFYPLKMEDINNLIFSKLNEWKADGELVDDTAVISCRFF